MKHLPRKAKIALKRKRNLIAKDLRQNKLYSPKVINNKKKDKRLSRKDILNEYGE